MKKNLLFLTLSLISLTACGQTTSTPKPAVKSDIKGTYNNSYTKNMKFRHTFADDTSSLYAISYPGFLIADLSDVKYVVDQQLSLRKDFTYVYTYSITLQNGYSNNIGKVEVNMNGSYTYTVINEKLNKYYVDLSNPEDGFEKIYGADINVISDLNQWSMHSNPDYSVNFYENLNNPSFNFSQYSCGRKVIVNKKINDGDPNVVEDSLYFRFIIDDIAHLSNEGSSR